MGGGEAAPRGPGDAVPRVKPPEAASASRARAHYAHARTRIRARITREAVDNPPVHSMKLWTARPAAWFVG